MPVIEATLNGRKVGRVRFKYLSEQTIHVTSLVTRHPQAIWILREALYRFPWHQMLLKRRKTGEWKTHWRNRYALAH